MAEDRMLNDEILLGLIKANGGGGGTTNYNQLENKPQIAGTELQGNKSLADLGIASADDVKNEFIGTLAEWNALSPAQQKAFDTYQITDDYSEALMPNYSTTEQKTGQKWIDGKDIYFKTFIFDTTDNVQTNIDVSGCSIDTNITDRINCGSVSNTYFFDGSDFLRSYLKNNKTILTIERGSASVKGSGSITLYYTKTA